MYPAAFDYHAPRTLEETLALLAELGPEAKLLAGGASLIPLLKLRLFAPTNIVDLGRVPGLDAVTLDGDGALAIGAMVCEADLGRAPAAAGAGVIADVVRVIGDPMVRNVGTVGGNLAHGDPANDQPAVMLALDATLVVRSAARGERTIPSADFHLDLLVTALEPDEVVTAIRVPASSFGPRTGSAYVKFERQAGDLAVAGAAAVVRIGDDGRIAGARVAFTNLAPTPRRSPLIEAALTGAEATREAAEAAAGALGADELDPTDDIRATAAVKWTMARAAAARAITRAAARAVANGGAR